MISINDHLKLCRRDETNNSFGSATSHGFGFSFLSQSNAIYGERYLEAEKRKTALWLYHMRSWNEFSFHDILKARAQRVMIDFSCYKVVSRAGLADTLGIKAANHQASFYSLSSPYPPPAALPTSSSSPLHR